MYDVVYLPKARQQLMEAALYIASELAAPQAAESLLDEVDKCVDSLKEMPYLMDLNVVNNLIDDIGPVKELKSLKRLWIYNYSRRKQAEVDEKTLAELQKALPGCYIDGISTSTAGGWREHPHYDVIYRMFRTHVYEPFADSPAENIPEGFAPHTDEGE